jgi:Protein of unknown function (DUF2630)
VEHKNIPEGTGGTVDEEHELYRKRSCLSAEEYRRMEHLKVELDRRWNLLRQRRVPRESGHDLDGARVMYKQTVEGYLL